MSNGFETRIREKLQSSLNPVHLVVENESHMHNVPKGSETHFRVLVVSEKFVGLKRIDRQRLVNEALAEELQGGVHALAQRALTPLEWSESDKVDVTSPPCYGGSKAK